MKISINKKLKNPDMIVGFPGWGFVGSISTNYLIEHLNVEKIGSVVFDEISPVVAIHEGKVMDNIGIFYSKEKNLVILHFVMHMAKGMEWKICNAVNEIIKKINPKEVINLEGVNSPSKKNRVMFHTNDNKSKKMLLKTSIELKDGIIIGPSAALMLSVEKPFIVFFSETASKMPDNEAAVRIIEVLNKIKGLNIDVKPLKNKAETFKKKINNLSEHMKKIEKKKERENISYVG